ncbi:hypothetical protein ABH930_002334 [Kitasatospora sp. GAS204A]|uniref:hypothetical protein n=1 Tax=unclassified Kitasatospora TaxID=2633591 RepID=UPI0024736B8A|nr:hypothetical protein [Kitasatospora sp. GAS204B]MDH6121661.1 hypothetical protein [Kitasatospora sp. GAS204B]
MTATPVIAAGPAPGRAAALDLRVLRALPFATVSVVLAVAGHALASGAGVPLGTVLLGWGLTGAVAVCGGRRERSLPAITGALGAAQLGLHLLFHLAQTARGAGGPGMTGMSGMAGMPGMSGMSGMSGMTKVPDLPAAGAPVAPHAVGWGHALLLGLTPAMLAGHLAATVLAGWWLRQGEAALWRLVRLAVATAEVWAVAPRWVLALHAALREGLGARWRRAARPVPSRAEARRLPSAALLRHCVIRRGPPGGPVGLRPLRQS